MKIDDLPTPNEYWKRPEAKTTGDDSPSGIFESVGKAITVWETFEVMLLFLYLGLIESKTEAARRAYGSIISAAGRKAAIKAAAESYFFSHRIAPDDSARFKRLMEHVEQATGRRNDIAHGAVVSVAGHGAFLFPAYYSTQKNRSIYNIPETRTTALDILLGEYRYTAADIEHFIARFSELDAATREVMGLILGRT